MGGKSVIHAEEGIGVITWAYPPPIMENQMEKKTQIEMETVIT